MAQGYLLRSYSERKGFHANFTVLQVWCRVEMLTPTRIFSFHSNRREASAAKGSALAARLPAAVRAARLQRERAEVHDHAAQDQVGPGRQLVPR